jgi:putative ABC transport system permease protein
MNEANGIIKLGMLQMACAYVFTVILLAIVKKRGIPREKEILIATIRMTLQLILTGYILSYVFLQESPWLTIVIILIMETFAVLNSFKRLKMTLSTKIKRTIAVSIAAGSLVTLIYFLFIVVRPEPWYNPRYFIPIAGMIVGNTMTGVSLGANRLIEGMQNQKDMVEAALMLGATPKMATKKIVNSAFDASILPTINSMVGMGIVSLPGMMTGQILSGTSPLVAIRYQIATMLGISGSVAFSVIIFLMLGYKTFFTSRSQLNL